MKKLIGTCLLICTATAYAAAPLPAQDSSFAFVDLLLWQVRESGAENWAQLFNITPSHTSVKLIDAPFGWNTGVRLGVGRTFNQNSFDVMMAYTHYQVTATNQTSGQVASAFDGAYFADNTNGAELGRTYHDANINWQFFYNTVDLNLGHLFILDPVLQIHPYLGLKAASINQTIYTNWQTPTIPTNFTKATENLKNDFSGLGPMLGADMNWAIYSYAQQSISLIGNIAGGLLWGHWHFNEVYTNNTSPVPTTITVYVSSLNGASPVVTGLLGLEWLKQFQKYDMSVRLGYEGQIWFNQVQFYSLSVGRANRPLSVQGGNLEFRLNF